MLAETFFNKATDIWRHTENTLNSEWKEGIKSKAEI